MEEETRSCLKLKNNIQLQTEKKMETREHFKMKLFIFNQSCGIAFFLLDILFPYTSSHRSHEIMTIDLLPSLG